MSESKEGLRKRLRAARQKLSPTQVELKSQQILNLVKTAVSWSDMSSLHIFLPMTGMNEPETSGILDFVWSKHSHIKTYGSVILPESKGMLTVPLTHNTPIATNIQGIPEPLGEKSVNLKLDLVLVPLIGFDKQGNRLGFGAGYYDRFLTEHPKALKIGLAFEINNVDHISSSNHDVAMDMVITEDRIYRF